MAYFSRTGKMHKPDTCYYKLLNCSAKADAKEIKTSYYKLAKKHHPDAQHNKEDKTEADLEESQKLFKQITEAYTVLSDQALRSKYDQLLFGDSANNSEFEN